MWEVPVCESMERAGEEGRRHSLLDLATVCSDRLLVFGRGSWQELNGASGFVGRGYRRWSCKYRVHPLVGGS